MRWVRASVVMRGVLLGGVWIGLGGGCEQPDKANRIAELEKENLRFEAALDEKDAKLSRQADTIHDQAQRIETLVGLGPDRLKKLYYPTRVVIDAMTGGADYDGKPGDDGVTVYLKPVDQEGHVIKAAGYIYVQLLDLAMPEGQKLLGEYALDVDHARKQWYGRFLTNHFTMKCPWQPGKGAPKNREITVRVEFIEYLTGTKLTVPSKASPASAERIDTLAVRPRRSRATR